MYRCRRNSILHRLRDDGVGNSGFIHGAENIGLVEEFYSLLASLSHHVRRVVEGKGEPR